MPTDTAPLATEPREQVHELQVAGAAGRRAISLGVQAQIAARQTASMLVVLCSDQAAQPLVSTGTLYP